MNMKQNKKHADIRAYKYTKHNKETKRNIKVEKKKNKRRKERKKERNKKKIHMTELMSAN